MEQRIEAIPKAEQKTILPFKKFDIDFTKPTVPFPEGFYLRENLLVDMEQLLNQGRVCEITGKDGAGKSTMIREATRYLQDKGYPVMLIDARIDLVSGDWRKFESFVEQNLKVGRRPILTIDNADNFWFRDLARGKGLAELKSKKKSGRLSKEEWQALFRLEDKEDFIKYLLTIKDKVGIVVVAHSKTTRTVRQFKDPDLRELFFKLRPIKLLLLNPYTKEEAREFLRHFGINDGLLIDIILGITRNHHDLKRIACLKLSDKWIEKIFAEEDVSPTLKRELWERALPKWLQQGKATIGKQGNR